MSTNSGDELRSIDRLNEPDARQRNLVVVDPKTGLQRAKTAADHHLSIAPYELDGHVPNEVVTQYEVARNLYLYAWFVWRFYNVAEAKLLTTLEFALRRALPASELREFKNERGFRSTGLLVLLRFVQEKGWIQSDQFAVWRERRRARATDEADLALIREMEEKGLSEIAVDQDSIDVDGYDLQWDFAEHLSSSLPSIRNAYAHGSPMLHNFVLESFDNVSTIINSVYDPRRVDDSAG